MDQVTLIIIAAFVYQFVPVDRGEDLFPFGGNGDITGYIGVCCMHEANVGNDLWGRMHLSVSMYYLCDRSTLL